MICLATVIGICALIFSRVQAKGYCLVLRKRHRDVFGKAWKMRWIELQGTKVGVFGDSTSGEAKYFLDLGECTVCCCSPG